ncbi:MAG: hypothetical protein HFJ65_02660 [Eggerthellaceae bacterium]|nr:hypothetical protein [Eggerthellaceae bacterium]
MLDIESARKQLIGLLQEHPKWKVWAMAWGLAAVLFIICAVCFSVIAGVPSTVDEGGAASVGSGEGAVAGTLAGATVPAASSSDAAAVSGAEQPQAGSGQEAAASGEAQAGAQAAPTEAQENALMSAKLHMSEMPYSHSGLVSVLEGEGYSHEDAVLAADRLGVDWTAKALEMAQQYLASMELSQSDLQEQLVYEGFTQEQAQAAAATALAPAA